MSYVYFNPSKKKFDVDYRQVGFASVLSTGWLLYRLTQARAYAHGKLLDVGCGIKPYQPLFEVDQYIGVDWPGSRHELNVESFADAQFLPFSDQSFDTLLCTEVIEHLPQPEKSFREMARVLKPGGHLILSAPFVHVHHEFPHDYYRFTYFGLQAQVRNAGLQMIAIWERGGPVSVLVDLTSRLVLSWSRAIMSKFHLPKTIQNLILRLMIGFPQRMVASLLINLSKRKNDKFENSFSPVSLSLGYVLVALRPVNSDGKL